MFTVGLQLSYSGKCGPYTTPKPLNGQQTTPKPKIGEYTTPKPLNGPYTAPNPLNGPDSAPRPLNGPHSTHKPLNGPYTTPKPLNGPHTTPKSLAEQNGPYVILSNPLKGPNTTHKLLAEEDLELSNRSTGAQLGFLVKIKMGSTGCTGTLIHPDWVITAFHCLKKLYKKIVIDKNGDRIVNLSKTRGYRILRKPLGGTRLAKDKLWTNPVKLKKMEEGEGFGWRKVELAVMHPGYKGQALSWKGADVALLKLSSSTMTEVQGSIVPICLPVRTKSSNDMAGKLYVAGYGRRKLPHCITNDVGPEKFGICGRPKDCKPKTTKCGLEFLYKGNLHNKCIHQETPSSHDPICKELLRSMSMTKLSTTTHVVSNTMDKILATCYSTLPAKNSKGWCTVRDPMHDENSEPEYEKGWGFCSEDQDQETCNDKINDDEIDLESFPVSQLSNNYCLEQLMLNLNIEQPEVKLEEVKHFPKLFCTGRNFSLQNDDHHFVQKKSGGSFHKLKYDNRLRKLLLKKSPSSVQVIDGGPSCLGDSGGPLFKIVGSVPVLEGVFSYMLWGTCRGRHEPSYHVRVSDFLDWIYRHVPKQEVCTGIID